MPLSRATEERQIFRIMYSSGRQVHDLLIREVHYPLFINGVRKADFYCTPDKLEALAAGHAFGQGWLIHGSQINSITVDEQSRSILMELKETPPEAAGVPAEKDGPDLVLSPGQVYRLGDDFRKKGELHPFTGSAHSCALANENGLLFLAEDVARHNSLDKVIGEMVLKNIGSSGKALIFSGRLSLDMLVKVSRCGVRLLIALGAPTQAAVELADRNDITILGFVRKDYINVYTHWHRIVVGASPAGSGRD
jgi:FdhD protein